MDVSAEAHQERGDISTSRADLENPLSGFDAQAYEHGGNRRRACHGLPAGQRQGDVGTRKVRQAPRREDLAWYKLHGAKELGVAYTARSQRQNESRYADNFVVRRGCGVS
jgi:hypothetical protein